MGHSRQAAGTLRTAGLHAILAEVRGIARLATETTLQRADIVAVWAKLSMAMAQTPRMKLARYAKVPGKAIAAFATTPADTLIIPANAASVGEKGMLIDTCRYYPSFLS